MLRQKIAKCTSNCIIIYNRGEYDPNQAPTKKQLDNLAKGQRGEYNGTMSSKTKSHTREILQNWITGVQQNNKKVVKQGNKSERKPLTFVTLTLSAKQIHSDNEIKRKMLNHFIIEMKRNYGLENYFWRAESQKNGNIHFHLIFDCYVNYMDLRNVWNNCQEKLGYITRFEVDYGHRNPNSTDIHSIKKMRNVVAYVQKYMCKGSETTIYRKIEGRIWGCSDNLKNTSHKVFVMEEVTEYGELISDNMVTEFVEKARKDTENTKVIFKENVEIIVIKGKSLLQYAKNSKMFHMELLRHYEVIFKGIYKQPTLIYA